MKRTIIAATIAVGFLIPTPAFADHGECRGNGCSSDEYENENSEGRNRGAFSPGPFTDSPVDAFNNNNICLPGSTCHFDGSNPEKENQTP